MGVIKKIWNSWRNKDPVLQANGKKIYEDPTRAGWSIYDENKSTGEATKKFHRIHFGFKYKLLVPALYVAKKFIKEENVVKKVENYPYNTNLKAFDDAWNRSLILWSRS